LLFIFGTILYAVVEITDRGLGALTFWSLFTATEISVFLFLFRRNYVELGDRHLTWVQWGHKRCKVAFSDMIEVALRGSRVCILLAKSPNLRRFRLARGTPAPTWLAIPAADPRGLASTIEGLLHAYGSRDVVCTPEVEEHRMPPEIALIPAERWRRLLAAALDVFFLVGLLFTVALAATAHLEEGEDPSGSVDFYVAVIVLAWALYLWLVNVMGVSLGKLQLGLRVVRAGTDRAPGPAVGTARLIAAVSPIAASLLAVHVLLIDVFYVGVFVLLAGFAWSFVDRERRAWHDMVARTRVVRFAYRAGSD
jgi:uncharacterized RDD family membrane protein YckC